MRMVTLHLNDRIIAVWTHFRQLPTVMAPCHIPDGKVHGANMGSIWGRQDPGGPHVDLMNFAIWDIYNDTGNRCLEIAQVAMKKT